MYVKVLFWLLFRLENMKTDVSVCVYVFKFDLWNEKCICKYFMCECMYMIIICLYIFEFDWCAFWTFKAIYICCALKAYTNSYIRLNYIWIYFSDFSALFFYLLMIVFRFRYAKGKWKREKKRVKLLHDIVQFQFWSMNHIILLYEPKQKRVGK